MRAAIHRFRRGLYVRVTAIAIGLLLLRAFYSRRHAAPQLRALPE
jgi:hypothetical protein